jgi:hypothetical protein
MDFYSFFFFLFVYFFIVFYLIRLVFIVNSTPIFGGLMVKVKFVLAALLTVALLALVVGPFVGAGAVSSWTLAPWGSWFCWPWCGWIIPQLPYPF